jgi:type II secretory pathway pseudopilin PulG
VWAFTLIEVLFASSILAGLSYFVLSAFFEGRRQALGTASTLSELLLARGVLEQLADQVEADPTALGRLTGYGAFWSQWSYVVRPSEPVSAPDGTPIDRPSPFLGFLAEGDPEAPAEPSADASASATAPQRDRPGAAAGGNSANRAYADLVMQLELRHSDWKPSGLSAGDSSDP